MSTSLQKAVISVQQPFQVANAKMIESFIEELPPISLKRQKKHRTILTHVSNWWLKKPFEETTKLDLKNIVIAINTKEDFKDWAKSDYRMVTKRFYRYTGVKTPELKRLDSKISNHKKRRMKLGRESVEAPKDTEVLSKVDHQNELIAEFMRKREGIAQHWSSEGPREA